MTPSAQEKGSPSSSPGFASLLVRLVWMLFGNFALVLLLILIVQTGSLSLLDGIFWATVGVLVAIRYVDISVLGGLTTDGEPATARHWRRYSVCLLAVSGGLWLLAHAAFGW